jgi:flagellar basal-body rod protein FlgF
MDALTAMAASGMRTRLDSLDMLANNIANASTIGYKADREFYSLYASSEAASDSDYGPATMPVIERPYTDLSQGVSQVTGNPLDVALSGAGFFAVQSPSGPVYTRNGSFRRAPDGTLVTGEGYAVGSATGKPIKMSGVQPVEIGSDGTITEDGKVIGQLQIVDFTSAAGLAKQGDNYFRAPSGVTPSRPKTSVAQGQLESSNSGTAESAVRLVSVMRQFEMLQKAASMGEDMNKQAIEQVAKVS